LFAFSPLTFNKVSGLLEEYATMRIENPIDQSLKFEFNATEYPVGSVFTVDFYIKDVTDMYGWQIYISWNISIINFTGGWFPDNHIFKTAEDDGAILISAMQFIEESQGMGYVKAGMVTMYFGNDPPYYPVSVSGKGLLCKMNFTILATPPEGEYYQTNIIVIKEAPGSAPGSLDSCVFLYPLKEKREIKAEPAQVRVTSASAEIPLPIQDIAIETVEISKDKIYVGENLTITINFKNYGNGIETFNFTLKVDDIELVRSDLTLGAGESDRFKYVWDVPQNMSLGTYQLVVYAEPLEFETEIANNTYETTITIEKMLTSFEYAMWLISLWFSTSLGTLLIIYVILVVLVLATPFVFRKLKRLQTAR
jgi:hypothetical protein